MKPTSGLVLFLLLGIVAPAPGDAEASGPRIVTGIEFHASEHPDRDIRVAVLSGGIATAGPRLRFLAHAGFVITSGKRIVQALDSLLEQEADGVGVELGVDVRLSPLEFASFTPYVQLGGGVMATTEAFPPGGTASNFTLRAGLGITAPVNDDLEIGLGLRTLHISNGKGFNEQSNPSYDGVGIRIELIRALP